MALYRLIGSVFYSGMGYDNEQGALLGIRARISFEYLSSREKEQMASPSLLRPISKCSDACMQRKAEERRRKEADSQSVSQLVSVGST